MPIDRVDMEVSITSNDISIVSLIRTITCFLEGLFVVMLIFGLTGFDLLIIMENVMTLDLAQVAT